jgi:hypothetical protein
MKPAALANWFDEEGEDRIGYIDHSASARRVAGGGWQVNVTRPVCVMILRSGIAEDTTLRKVYGLHALAGLFGVG